MSVDTLPRQGLTPLRVVRVDQNARAIVEIYRPFFVAGVASVLTAGCLLGAIALFGISMNASYTASAWTPHILAHANSQLYGWVAFFVMGFSLQTHAPSVGRSRLFHRLAFASLILMGTGIAVRFAAEPLVGINRGIWMPIGVASCLAQTVAVAIFVTNITWTRHRSGNRMPWQSVLVLASLFCLLAVSIAEPFFFASSHAADPASGIMFVAKWFMPYREAQFLGFVALMIFGVALVKMNTCFGAESACPKLGITGFVFWTIGLLLRMSGWVYAFDHNFEAGSTRIYALGGPCMMLGAVLLIASSRIFRKLDFTSPSQKFVRAAFAWLLVAGLLLVLEPIHLNAIGRPFSHAFIGAVRHAATVGFISQMIVGVGMQVAARMNDLPRSLERPLWATFWLLNLGNAARVGLEIWTDYNPAAFAPMGFTGFVELVGLALWGAYILRLLLGRRRVAYA